MMGFLKAELLQVFKLKKIPLFVFTGCFLTFAIQAQFNARYLHGYSEYSGKKILFNLNKLPDEQRP